MEFMKKIEEISKKVGKTATEAYNTVSDKSGKLIEETKMKISKSDKENEIVQIFENMGRTVYDMYKEGEDVGKVFAKECKNVDRINAEIVEMNKKILYNKGLRECSSCGETIGLESTFCTKCGQKQKTVKIKEEKKEEKEVEEKKAVVDVVCPQCGLVLNSNNSFCSKCGYNLEK